ncbi:hypothetical protein [uncultured Microbacterium sp.]|uniref:hypothetical protein n=1 Tax=uncultured Microbacterium sp. TaxID=191216 RepID=UPI0025D67DE6|nr:hypothetical protein [uncultured Microbacterium sp.]
MSDYLDGWNDFDVAMVGATSALAGLVIVAASVNIEVIIQARFLTARLASGIVGLALALTGSALGLVPHLAPAAYGAIMIVAGAIGGAVGGVATRAIYANPSPENRLRPVKAAIGFVAPLAYLVGGILLLAGQPSALGWFAAGAIGAIAASLLISWIALVEVLR